MFDDEDFERYENGTLPTELTDELQVMAQEAQNFEWWIEKED